MSGSSTLPQERASVRRGAKVQGRRGRAGTRAVPPLHTPRRRDVERGTTSEGNKCVHATCLPASSRGDEEGQGSVRERSPGPLAEVVAGEVEPLKHVARVLARRVPPLHQAARGGGQGQSHKEWARTPALGEAAWPAAEDDAAVGHGEPRRGPHSAPHVLCTPDPPGAQPSDTPGSWAPAPPRRPNRCESNAQVTTAVPLRS